MYYLIHNRYPKNSLKSEKFHHTSAFGQQSIFPPFPLQQTPDAHKPEHFVSAKTKQVNSRTRNNLNFDILWSKNPM